MSELAEKIKAVIKEALKAFGKHNYYDKQAWETCGECNDIEEAIRALPKGGALALVKELASYEHAEHLLSGLESIEEDDEAFGFVENGMKEDE